MSCSCNALFSFVSFFSSHQVSLLVKKKQKHGNLRRQSKVDEANGRRIDNSYNDKFSTRTNDKLWKSFKLKLSKRNGCAFLLHSLSFFSFLSHSSWTAVFFLPPFALCLALCMRMCLYFFLWLMYKMPLTVQVVLF